MAEFLAFLRERGVDPNVAKRLLRESSRNRTGVLKAAGNMIVPFVAAVFISTVMEALGIEPEWSDRR